MCACVKVVDEISVEGVDNEVPDSETLSGACSTRPLPESEHQEEGDGSDKTVAIRGVVDNADHDAVDTIRGLLLTLDGMKVKDARMEFVISGQNYHFTVQPTNRYSTAGTKLFLREGNRTPKLYWYNSVQGLHTPSKSHIAMCGIIGTNNVIADIWQTRCNRPHYHYIIFSKLDNSCTMLKESKEISKIKCDLSIPFDAVAVEG